MSEGRFVFLQGGMVVPLAAVIAALNIERAGHRLRLDGDGLFIEPDGSIDPEDLAELRRWKPHVRLLLAYVADDRHLRDEQRPRPDVGPVLKAGDHA
jgi:hypothetical protein